MKLTRDSALWWLTMIVAICGVVSSHFDLVTKAMPSLVGPQGQAWLELVSMVALAVSAYLRGSPLALNENNPLATKDASNTLTVLGNPKP